jgi:cell wall-associated NlpC family hydrolase
MQSQRWILLISLAVMLAACAGPRVATGPVTRPVPAVAKAPVKTVAPATVSVLGTARQMLGTPYRYGGSSPSGFDCSGLVSYAYRSVGIRVPRTSSEQFRQAQRVPLQNLQPGDLLFFRLSPPKISHVAIYDRDGRFIHAPSSGKRVSYASLDNPYWRQHLVGAGRF